MVAIVDINSFYCSAQIAFNPALYKKPVVVLSNNDGCVISLTKEAKDLGLKMGANAFENEKFFVENGVHVFSANFALYENMSLRVMDILKEYSTEVEKYSIDEMFLNCEGMESYDLRDFGMGIKNRILKWTGMPVCVGIAPSKALAKLANRIAKKFPALNGVHVIDSPELHEKALKWLKIGDVWGIGRKHERRLLEMGIKNAYDFTRLADQTVLKLMSIVGLRLKKDLEGQRTIQYEKYQAKKIIAVSRSFDRNYKTLAEVLERVISFAVICTEKLRKQNSECEAITVFISSNGFRTDLEQYHNSVEVKLPFATDSSIELAKYAEIALMKIYKEGIQYKRAGVVVSNITPSGVTQMTIFEAKNEKHDKVMLAMDTINRTVKGNVIKLAAQDLGRKWKMKQERLSPRYHRIEECIVVGG
jgi:DNA polymerase V